MKNPFKKVNKKKKPSPATKKKPADTQKSKHANDSSWKKGQSGNPNGSSKKARLKQGQTLTALLREKLDPEEWCETLIQRANAGNDVLIKYIGDRVDGRPRQNIKLSSEKDSEWAKVFQEVKSEADKKAEGDSDKRQS